jgi:hypothetical protein
VDVWVGRLHSRYQFYGTSSDLSAAARLNGLLKTQVLEEYEKTLERQLEGDEAIYVVQRVKPRLTLRLENGLVDQHQVQYWGRQMAQAVIRQILYGDGVVRFEDQSDYLAHFVVDVLKGRAWDSRLYGPFQRLRYMPPAQAARAALLENTPALHKALGRLHHLGMLGEVLAALAKTDLGELWAIFVPPAVGDDERSATGENPTSSPRQVFLEQARPFCAAAFSLAGRLEMWARPKPRLESWAMTISGVWRPPDWRDPHALALALRDVLRLLAEQGYLRRPNSPELAGNALEGLDWIDLETFRQAFRDLLESPAFVRNAPMPGMSRAGLTPRQQKLLEDLLDVLDGARLDVRWPGVPENGLRLLGALADAHPEWAGDPLAARFAGLLLAAWDFLAGLSCDQQAGVLAALRQGGLPAVERILPSLVAEQARTHLQPVIALGDGAARILAALSRVGYAGAALPAVEDGAWIEAESLGAAMLLRAVLDTRLPALLARSGYPDPSLPLETRLPAVILALLLFWSGTGDLLTPPEGPESDRPVPPALLMLAGAWDQDVPIHTQAGLLAVWQASGLPAGRQATISFLGDVAGQVDGLGLAGAVQEISGFVEEYTSREESPPAPALVGLLGGLLLRLWARWLRNFSGSSPEYLRANWLDRPGQVSIDARSVRVELEARPLDVVLEMAGYLAPLERLPWLAGRTVTFRTH